MNISGSCTHSGITAVEASKIFLLLNHGPIAFVTSTGCCEKNIVRADWVMPVDSTAPKVALMLDQALFSQTAIPHSGEFALSILPRGMAAEDDGRSANATHASYRSPAFNTFETRHISAPLLRGCSAWLECRLLPQASTQRRHDFYLAEVITAWTQGALAPV